MSKQEIFEIQKRKLVKKNQQNEENEQIQDSQSQGTQELERSQNQDKGHGQKSQNTKDQAKSFLQQKISQLNQASKSEKNYQSTIQMKKDALSQISSKKEIQIFQTKEQQNKIKKIQKQSQQINKINLDEKTLTLSQNKRPIYILAVSDNHGDYKAMNQILDQKGDIFIHAGDFTYQGKDEDFQKFFAFLDKINFRHKIVIAGNHENVLSKFKLKTITRIEIEGLKIFASPYTPQYCQKPTSRAFQYKSSSDKIIWENIPKDIDLLITHGPPFGILDNGKNGKRAGSQALRQAVLQIKPKYHIFGHIHQMKGEMMKIGETTFINLCNTPTRLIMKTQAKYSGSESQ